MAKAIHKDVQVIIDELEGREIEVTPLLRSALMDISKKLADKEDKAKADLTKAMQEHGITKIKPGAPEFGEICRKFEELQRARLNLKVFEGVDKECNTATSRDALLSAKLDLIKVERDWKELSDRFKDDKPGGSGGSWEQRDFDLYNTAVAMPNPLEPKNEQIKECWLCRLLK